jgi:GlcNAc-P-P-Und epimerase
MENSNVRNDTCVIFGGTGFIGAATALKWHAERRFKEIILCDIREPLFPLPKGIRFIKLDVRQEIAADLCATAPNWILNLAAVHREPGHEEAEYYETNVLGAHHVCKYATTVGCQNILFTSSIAVYGASPNGSVESDATIPVSAYGGSKLLSEHIHHDWRKLDPTRRLIVMRPAVIYGPGDPGNILRMYKAIKLGLFAIPGNPNTRKSYGYVDELINAFEFLMAGQVNPVTANFAIPNALSISELSMEFRRVLGKKGAARQIPLNFLIAVSYLFKWTGLGGLGVHPTRVRKVARPTYVEPATLLSLGYPFKFTLETSFEDWQKKAPKDFQ